jgi:orotidine-5'-phosphate decarboxylase
MNRQELFQLIQQKKSFLCVGLDSDINKIPKHLLEFDDPVFEFNRRIIDATIDVAIAYKPNCAFYESRGSKGLQSLERTIQYIRTLNQPVFAIADAKRGDIGNTSEQYARAFLDPAAAGMDFDAITVSPYMGSDSVKPFLKFDGKWVILLVLTSNEGAEDFQYIQSSLGVTLEKLGIKTQRRKLFEQVIVNSYDWGNEDNMMFVIGATKAEMLENVRYYAPYHFLLVPGVGAQGGSLREVAKYGMNKQCGLIVNASRSIIFASSDTTFAEAARQEAIAMQQEMQTLLEEHELL